MPTSAAQSRQPAGSGAPIVVRLLARVLAGTLVLATAACSSQLSVFKQGPGMFLFPELLPDTVPVSPPLSLLGAVCGNVQDPNHQPLPGATITDGAAVTVAGDGTNDVVFPTREINATDNPQPIAGIDGATLSDGDFVLDGLPPGANTIVVSFDEVKTEVPVFVGPSSFSAEVNKKVGPPNYQASEVNPSTATNTHCGVVILPFYRSVQFADGLRVADVEPPVLQGQLVLASGSAPVVTWPGGSKIAIVLRIDPPAATALQVSTASIVYQDDSGRSLPDPSNPAAALQVDRTLDPQVTVLPGTSKTSGPSATVLLDLATSKLASDDVAAAQIHFIISDPATPAVARPATDPRDQALSITVPLRLQVNRSSY